MDSNEPLRKDAKRAYKSKDYTLAVDLYAKLVEAGNHDPMTGIADRSGYAASLIGLGRIDEASIELERIVATVPGDAPSRQKLAALLTRLGRHEEALEHLLEAARLEPNTAEYHWRLAAELRALGRDDEAREALTRCLELEPANPHARIMELELSYLGAPERDGQEELESAPLKITGPAVGMFDPMSRIGGHWTIIEAVALFVVALWLCRMLN